MDEKNGVNENPQPLNEVCTIRIVFPVKSDEQALAIKTNIKTLLKDIPEAQVHFSLMPMPTHIPMGLQKPL